MINNFNKNFFNKNKAGLRICIIALTGMMVASPFMVKGIVNKDSVFDRKDLHFSQITSIMADIFNGGDMELGQQ